ncbi:transglycosylase SLT domain-containing protein [Micromonospora rifamycinica]|uniref:Transglycosylase SLT domain-containing protein n=1 Tax=Micromonospora rifamycinica TaxID=291594 RepID=A0A1C5GXB1_9ACTN|nr:transglycosylase SLT domain-containing protein [Micromonospora rifamycinica]SCG38404.1 Transglycosylase SLT domain-containing protein [Micromonospora rifamycinica]
MAASDNDGAEPTQKSNRSTAALIGAAVAAGLSCLATPVAGVIGAAGVFVIGALGVLLAPLVALILLFGGGGSADPVRAADDSLAAAQGDGKGALDPEQVPEGLADSIEEAGKTCPQIGPVVIAAQIEVASGWDPAKVGANGEKGISQLPPEVFTRYGEDADDDGDTDATDEEDSIAAQAAHVCALAGQAQALLDNGQAIGEVLDLTLVAYAVGIDEVRRAGGVPSTNEAQLYLAQVRSLFAKYQGLGGPPPSFPPTATPSAEPTGD